MGTDMRGMKGKNDTIPRDASSNKFVSNAFLNAIVMNPDLTVANFSMDDRAVDSMSLFPALMHEKIVTPIPADDNIGCNINIAVGNASIILQNFSKDSRHWSIASGFD
jgi:hypothetical protein